MIDFLKSFSGVPYAIGAIVILNYHMPKFDVKVVIYYKRNVIC